MVAKGTTPHPVRVPDEIWKPAIAAFPAERGRSSGLSVEVVGFIEFLAENPERWRAVKTAAAGRGISPWVLVAEALERATQPL